MVGSNTITAGKGSDFETIRRINDHGAEYWSARELQPLLGYEEWRKFEGAIQKAITSCKESENDPDNHFVGADKMVALGSGSTRKVKDYHLSRFACYLIAQNGDPRKKPIARAQQYFAVQTRRQEVSDALEADRERLELRRQAHEEFKALSSAARLAGVQHKNFGKFHEAGYKGLYGGLTNAEIKEQKSIPLADPLMDRMGTTELAANQFRMTQTREKLMREGIRTEGKAIKAHESVGREVREAIARIGGTMPEDEPAAEHIQQVEARVQAVERIGKVPKKAVAKKRKTPQN